MRVDPTRGVTRKIGLPKDGRRGFSDLGRLLQKGFG